MGLVLPIAGSLGLARKGFKHSEESGGKSLGFVDEGGAGGKSRIGEYYIKWEGFRSIRETRKYIFLKTTRGTVLIIFKSDLSEEQLSSMKMFLAAAPVKNKTMLPEN